MKTENWVIEIVNPNGPQISLIFGISILNANDITNSVGIAKIFWLPFKLYNGNNNISSNGVLQLVVATWTNNISFSLNSKLTDCLNAKLCFDFLQCCNIFLQCWKTVLTFWTHFYFDPYFFILPLLILKM